MYGEDRATTSSLTLNLGINGLDVTCDEPPTTNGRASELLARTASLSGHPSKKQPRSKLLDSKLQLYIYIKVEDGIHWFIEQFYKLGCRCGTDAKPPKSLACSTL
ncbi:hypothetical protein J6590_063773 [Homalodisca vitripennis]|nr:hypothetical protein J6590_063773 [Homalodisca vitripennis]